MINKNDGDFYDYKISVKEFAEQWNIDIKSNNLYDKLKPLTDEVMKSYILIEKINNRGKRVLEAFSIFTKYKYIEGEGFFRVKINPDLKDYFLNLKKNFTQYSLKNLILLNENNASAVTMRTYELVKQYEKLENRHLKISEYKRAVGLLEMDNTGKIIFEKYKGNNANLKQYALIPAKQLINTYTDVLIDYNITGRGSNAVINFSIKTKKENEQISKQNELPNKDTIEFDEFLDNNFTDEEQLIMSVVPEEVHSYDKDKLKAIYSLSAIYTSGIDKEMAVINKIGRFTMAIWTPTKARNCKTNNKYGYYYSCFQAWLENQKS